MTTCISSSYNTGKYFHIILFTFIRNRNEDSQILIWMTYITLLIVQIVGNIKHLQTFPSNNITINLIQDLINHYRVQKVKTCEMMAGKVRVTVIRIREILQRKVLQIINGGECKGLPLFLVSVALSLKNTYIFVGWKTKAGKKIIQLYWFQENRKYIVRSGSSILLKGSIFMRVWGFNYMTEHYQSCFLAEVLHVDLNVNVQISVRQSKSCLMWWESLIK